MLVSLQLYLQPHGLSLLDIFLNVFIIMLLLLLVYVAPILATTSTDPVLQEPKIDILSDEQKTAFGSSTGAHVTIIKPHQGKNQTNDDEYFEKSDNLMRLPFQDKNFDASKWKKKIPKKSPKRTIQKIIKKNRMKHKLRKTMTSEATTQTVAVSVRKVEVTTTQPQRIRKKPTKKKSPRYQVPFHHMQRREQSRKFKRELDRDNTYILNNFNEIQFLKHDKDSDTVRVHVQKYW